MWLLNKLAFSSNTMNLYSKCYFCQKWKKAFQKGQVPPSGHNNLKFQCPFGRGVGVTVVSSWDCQHFPWILLIAIFANISYIWFFYPCLPKESELEVSDPISVSSVSSEEINIRSSKKFIFFLLKKVDQVFWTLPIAMEVWPHNEQD